MDYIICQEPGHFRLKQKEKPPRAPNQALIKIEAVGICGTDLHAYAGNQPYFSYPRILGHELAGSVVEIDPHPSLQPGDQVVVIPYLHCGQCIACDQGKTNCCAHLQVLGVHTDGGMQEYLSIHHDLLIPAPRLDFQQMAVVEPLAIGAHALRRADIKKGEFMLVIGCGPIGLGLMKQGLIAGAQVIAMDLNHSRLQYASEVLGVSYTVNATNRPLEQMLEITDNALATAVFDATGNRQALQTGHHYMAHGGRYVLVGLSKDHLSFSHPEIHAKETSILCSRNATREDFQQVISLLEQNSFPTDSYITHTVPYDQMIDQFEHWLDPENQVIKATIEF